MISAVFIAHILKLVETPKHQRCKFPQEVSWTDAAKMVQPSEDMFAVFDQSDSG